MRKKKSLWKDWGKAADSIKIEGCLRTIEALVSEEEKKAGRV